MAVYTDVTADDLTEFLSRYEIGELLSYKGIAEGVENSNFLVHTDAGNFILTLYEKRVAAADLPFFLALMEHLAARGITCPQPVKNKQGGVLGKIAGRPAAIVTFLDGLWIRRPNAGHCAAVGEALAGLHLAGADFKMRRSNALSIESWRVLYEHAKDRGDSVRPGLCAEIAKELDALDKSWPRDLPDGVIHADLFPDNVFFLGDKLSGLIDFYFACTDTLAYDVAICLNAWCFESDHSYNVTKGRALLKAYAKVRALTAAERAALPMLARGAAMRFLLTRLVDWLAVPDGALVKPKDPLEYFRKLRFHQSVKSVSDYGIEHVSEHARHHPYRWRLFGQSGPGRLGRDPDLRRPREGIERRRAAHHQQPHGVDGGDFGAGSAETSLRGRSLHRQRIYARRHHRLDQWLEEKRLAHRRQEAGEECRSVEAAR